jgi:hypothetical protein
MPIENEKLEGPWGVHGYDRPIENMNPESIGRLTNAEMKRIYEEAGKTLEKYGYGPPDTYAAGGQVKKLE